MSLDKKENTGQVSKSEILTWFKSEKEKIPVIKKQLDEKEITISKIIELMENPEMSGELGSAATNPVTDLKKEQKENSDPKNLKSMGGYPYVGSREEKILHILRAEGKAMRYKEVAEVMEQIEGPESADSRSVQYAIGRMAHDGILLYGKIHRSNRHTFFIFKDWLDELKTLKTIHYPDPNCWGTLAESRRRVDLIKWRGL